MSVVPRDLRFNGRWTTTLVCQVNRAAHGAMHREKIGAVDALGRHAKAACATGDVTGAHRVRRTGVLGIAIVFEHKNRGQFQHHRQIHRFEYGTLVRAAVTPKSDAYRVIPAPLAGYGGPHCQRRPAADDRVSAKHSLGDVGDVHRAALTFAKAVASAVDLFHHAADVATLGDTVAVPSMGTYDVVSIAEQFANAHSDRFLSSVQMGETRDLTSGNLNVQALLKFTDQFHLPVSA